MLDCGGVNWLSQRDIVAQAAILAARSRGGQQLVLKEREQRVGLDNGTFGPPLFAGGAHSHPRADGRGRDEYRREGPRCGDGDAMLPRELAQPVSGRRRSGLDRLARQISLDVAHQVIGRLIPPFPVLLERLVRDPVELAAHQPCELRRLHIAVRGDRRQPVGF